MVAMEPLAKKKKLIRGGRRRRIGERSSTIVRMEKIHKYHGVVSTKKSRGSPKIKIIQGRRTGRVGVGVVVHRVVLLYFVFSKLSFTPTGRRVATRLTWP